MPSYFYLRLDTTPPTLHVIAPSVVKEDELISVVVTSNEPIDDNYEIYYLNDQKNKVNLVFSKINDRVLSGYFKFEDIKSYEVVILFIKVNDIVLNATRVGYALNNDTEGIYYEVQPPEYNNEYFSSEKPQDVSDIMSSIFSFVKDHYLSFFEPDFFKTVRVKSRLEGITDFRSFMHSIPKLKAKPIIVFDPDNIEMVEETIFSDNDLMRNPLEPGGLNGSPVYSVPFIDLGPYVEGNTMGLLYRMNRYRIQTNMMMIVEGRANQLNLYNYILMNIRHKSMYTLKAPISCRLDSAHILNIAKILNMDYKSQEFLNVLNSKSIHPIRKISKPNNQIIFYMVAQLNLFMSIPSYPSMDTPGKNGMVEEAARLTTGIIVEVDMPSMYQFLVSTEIIKDPVIGITTPGSPMYIAPLVNLNVPRNMEGMLNLFTVDVMIEDPKDNTISIYDLFEDRMGELVNYLKAKDELGVLSEYLIISVYANSTAISTSINNFSLVVNEASPLVLYTIAVYVNESKINKETNDQFIKLIGTLKFEQ